MGRWGFFSFSDHTEVRVSGSPCYANDVSIEDSDVVFRGVTLITVYVSTEGDAFRIKPPAARVRLENFDIVGDSGQFNSGVVVAAASGQSVADVTVQDVRVLDATAAAGIEITSPGTRVCFVDTEVSRAGDLPDSAMEATGSS